MSGNIDALKLEMARLEEEYLTYINQHGFIYREYTMPGGRQLHGQVQEAHGPATGVKQLEY